MRFFTLVLPLLILCFARCGDQNLQQADTHLLQNKVDSLSAIVAALTPGLGEFMASMDYHHGNLNRAAAAGNLERVVYEADEIDETLAKIAYFYPRHEKMPQPAVNLFRSYIKSPLEDLRTSKDRPHLVAASHLLTAGCNNCHKTCNVPIIVPG